MAFASTSRLAPPEAGLLAKARSGDESAFRRLVEPHQTALHAHCYRMLASVHDADDALQETLLRAWRALGRFEGRGSIRSWLYTIATNACLDLIARRPKRVLPIDYGAATAGDEGPGPPLPESVWVEPYPDETLAVEDGFAVPEARYEQRESIELAFVAALQHLPPLQRAVLILREVLGFSAREVAESLGTTTASVNSALQRARSSVDERLPDRSQQATLRALGDERVRELVERFITAWDRCDVEAMVAMLTDDHTFEMPPFAHWHRGRDAADAFLPAPPGGRWRLVPARANAQLAFGAYRWDPDARRHRAEILDVVSLQGERIARVTAFATPRIFERFGLPAELPPDGASAR